MKEKELLDELAMWYGTYPFSDKNEQAYQQILALITKFDKECVKSFDAGYKAGVIEKPRVTEEWIEEKANELKKFCYEDTGVFAYIEGYKDFIRSLVEEIRGNK